MEALTGKQAAITYHGEPWDKYYEDKFKARRSLALAAVNRGWSMQDCELVFLDKANACSDLWLTGTDGRPLGGNEAWKRVARDYDAVSGYQKENPGYKTAADARARIGELKMLALEYPWRGAAGRTDRDVLRVVHDAATRIGCTEIDLSTREASLMAGISRWTAGKSIHRLEAAGWLERKGTPLPGHAPRFKLTTAPLPAGSEGEGVRTFTPHGPYPGQNHVGQKYSPVAALDHEVWVRLGKVCMDLHSSLDDVPVSGREAGRRAGCADRTARLNLPVLVACGLASHGDDGWVRLTDDLDAVAASMGWTGANSKRAMRGIEYQADSARHKADLEDWVMPAGDAPDWAVSSS
jgi:hypothetical protein